MVKMIMVSYYVEMTQMISESEISRYNLKDLKVAKILISEVHTIALSKLSAHNLKCISVVQITGHYFQCFPH